MTAPFSKAQIQGYKACLAGRSFKDNPYKWGDGPEPCKAWNAGYAAARTDMARANRKVTPASPPKG